MTQNDEPISWQSRLLVPAVQNFQGIQLVVLFHAAQSLLALFAGAFTDGISSRFVILAIAGVHAWTAWGLTRAHKPAWHLAAFLAFAGIVLGLLAVACAPGKLAEGDITLLDVTGEMLMLVLSFLVWSYIRRPDVREVYGVPVYGEDHREWRDE
jgi:hypothetical protein